MQLKVLSPRGSSCPVQPQCLVPQMSVCILVVTVTAPIVGVTAPEGEWCHKGFGASHQNNIGTDICILNTTNYQPA
jgi:hypothetical protein